MKDELEGRSWQREQCMPFSEKRLGSFEGGKASQCGWNKMVWELRAGDRRLVLQGFVHYAKKFMF